MSRAKRIKQPLHDRFLWLRLLSAFVNPQQVLPLAKLALESQALGEPQNSPKG